MGFVELLALGLIALLAIGAIIRYRLGDNKSPEPEPRYWNLSGTPVSDMITYCPSHGCKLQKQQDYVHPPIYNTETGYGTQVVYTVVRCPYIYSDDVDFFHYTGNTYTDKGCTIGRRFDRRTQSVSPMC